MDYRKKFTMCIEFDDPITNGKGYSCAQVLSDDIISSLENINDNVIGYFFVSIVGFNNVFFFPQSRDNPKTITENIFQWKEIFSLEEKTYFFDKIQKILTSSYKNQITFPRYEEIYVNGENATNQTFFVNNVARTYVIRHIIVMQETCEHNEYS